MFWRRVGVTSASRRRRVVVTGGRLSDDDVRGREENSHRGHDREEGEGDETEPVENHGRELPVVLDGRRILVVADLVRDDPQLLENQVQLSIDAGREWARSRRRDGVPVGRGGHAEVIDGTRGAADDARRQWRQATAAQSDERSGVADAGAAVVESAGLWRVRVRRVVWVDVRMRQCGGWPEIDQLLILTCPNKILVHRIEVSI